MAVIDFEKIELDTLNKEILDHSNKVYQVLSLCITVTGALLGLLFTANPKNLPFGTPFLPFLSLLPFSVILPSIILVHSSFNSIVRIATYIMVVYEERFDTGIRWQTAVQKCREGKENRKFMKGVGSVFWVLTLVCLSVSITGFTWVMMSGTLGELAVYYVVTYTLSVISLILLVWRQIRELRVKWENKSFDKMAKNWV